MAKRYMICPIIGSGLTLEDPFRSAAQSVPGVNATALIPTNGLGAPVYHFAFCRVGVAGSLASVAAVSNSFLFPDFPLDSQMAQMDSDVRAAMVQSVQAYNIDGNGLHLTVPNDDTDSFRTVITAIAQQFEPAFNADHFDVSEPTQ